MTLNELNHEIEQIENSAMTIVSWTDSRTPALLIRGIWEIARQIAIASRKGRDLAIELRESDPR